MTFHIADASSPLVMAVKLKAKLKFFADRILFFYGIFYYDVSIPSHWWNRILKQLVNIGFVNL